MSWWDTRQTAVSLSDLLVNRTTRDEVRAVFDPLLPEYRRTVAVAVERRVQSVSGHPQLVGTAFDYAVRLELGHLAGHALSSPWAAEQAVALLPGSSTLGIRAARVVREARRAAEKGWPSTSHRRYSRIAAHAARLAQLDPMYRVGYPPTFGEGDGIAEKAIACEVVDLLDMAEPLWELATRKPLLLNPTFGRMSQAIGGADADLIAGDLLVELKTIRHALVERDHARQLVAYAALAACGRTGRLPRLRAVAVYFSRFGVLYTMELPERVPKGAFVKAAARLRELWQGRRARRAGMS